MNRPPEGSTIIFRTKVAALLAAPALALIAPAVLSTAPAQASVHAQASVAAPAGLGAKICQGDVCIQSQNGNALQQNIRAWANTSGFKGHFEMDFGCAPGVCNVVNSPNQYWRAGGSGYIFDGIPSGVGACVKALSGPFSTGSRWRGLGDVCFEVGGF